MEFSSDLTLNAVLNEADYYTSEEVYHALKSDLNLTSQSLVVKLLTRLPKTDSSMKPWPKLSQYLLGTAVSTHLLNEDQEDQALTSRAWTGLDHLMADTLGWLKKAMEAAIHDRRNPFLMMGAQRGKTHSFYSERIDIALQDPRTHLACMDAIYKILSPHFGKSILDALKHEPNIFGFYSDFFCSSAEDMSRDWTEDLGNLVDISPTKMVWKTPYGGYFLSVLRARRATDSENKTYDILAMLHDHQDKLIGRVTLLLNYRPENGTPLDMLSDLYQIDSSEVLEAGVGLMRLILDEPLAHHRDMWIHQIKHLALVRSWHIREEDRGLGIGKQLLIQALKYGKRGLPQTRVLAIRPGAAQFLVPSVSRWSAERFPEFIYPQEHLKNYWRKNVVMALALEKAHDNQCFEVPYSPACHINPHFSSMIVGHLQNMYLQKQDDWVQSNS